MTEHLSGVKLHLPFLQIDQHAAIGIQPADERIGILETQRALGV